MQVERRPARFRQRPGFCGLPSARPLDEEMNRGLLQYSGIDSLEPVIEPAQRFIGVLVQRAIEVDGRTNRHLLRSFPFLECADVARQVEAIETPVGTDIGRHLSAVCKIDGALTVEL